MAKVKYYGFSKPKSDRLAKEIEILEKSNPLFNFDQEFFDNLQGVSTLDLGGSVPYISIKTVDLQGDVIEDLNINFFTKTPELNKIGTGGQHSDRPTMSLKNISLKTTLASGYLYYTDVVLSLKIHSPKALTEEANITSLILPGMPHLLEYGWNSPDPWLNDSKEQLLFQVVTYDISIDETGQVDLTVKGKAFNDRFNNTLVGDDSNPIESAFINNIEADGNHRSKEVSDAYIKYLKEGLNKKPLPADYTIKHLNTQHYRKLEDIARSQIKTNFRARKDALSKLASKNKNIVKFHDVVSIMMNETFVGMSEAWPRVKEFRIIYGDINQSIEGSNVPRSIAEFPIDMKELNGLLRKEVSRGNYMTVQKFLNLLISKFVENQEIWTALMKGGVRYNKPDIVMNFSNRAIKESGIKSPGSGNMVMELTIHDAKHGIPPTSNHEPKNSNPVGIESKVESAVVGASAYSLPILRVGHANSFVKNLSLSQITNQAMKSVLLSRMAEDRRTGPRSVKPLGTSLESTPVTPLTLPLRGTLDVIGHQEWKPFRSIYLSSGIFLVDGVYKITEVTHNLSTDGFTTNLTLMYN